MRPHRDTRLPADDNEARFPGPVDSAPPEPGSWGSCRPAPGHLSGDPPDHARQVQLHDLGVDAGWRRREQPFVGLGRQVGDVVGEALGVGEARQADGAKTPVTLPACGDLFGDRVREYSRASVVSPSSRTAEVKPDSSDACPDPQQRRTEG